MSESYILVNETKEQYVEPSEFLPKYDSNNNHAVYSTDKERLLAATQFIDWAVGKSSWVLPYLLANTVDDGRIYRVFGSLFGSWSGDEIRLVGGVTNTHETIKKEYENISRELYEEVSETDTDLPPSQVT